MALKGSIKEFGLPEIFELILHQKKEGILTLNKDQTTVSILFKDGKITLAYKGNRNEALAQKLTKAKILSDDQLVIAHYRQENTKKSFEGVLVDLEFISSTELKRLNRLFTEETIFNIFDWQAGDYEFQQKDIEYNALLTNLLDTQFILMEAVRQIDEWPALLKRIPSRKSVFEKAEILSSVKKEKQKTSRDAEDFFAEIGEENSDESEASPWLIQQIDGKKTVQQIIDQAQLGAFSVHQGLNDLLAEKKIKETINILSETDKKESTTYLSKKMIIKSLVGVVVTVFTTTLFILSYPSLQFTSLRALRSIQGIKTLSDKNEQHFIRFALDLYYFKHNRYPDSLQDLIQEGFFGNQGEWPNHLLNWSYRLESGGRYKLTLTQKEIN